MSWIGITIENKTNAKMIKRGLAEFIGTFFLCLLVCMTLMSKHPEFFPFAAGFIYLAMIYANGHISGAHFNPMISVAILIRGKMQLSLVPIYILSQMFAAAMAGMVSLLLWSGKHNLAPLDLSSVPLQAILSELIGSFGLAYVALNVTTSKNTLGNDYYGLAMGLSFCGLSLALGNISGGIFNPAIAMVMAIANLASFSDLWIHWVSEFIGAVLAAFVFLYVNGKE